MHRPAVAAVVAFGGFLAKGNKALQVIEKRQVAFRQVADLGRPIVHLEVDIKVVVAVPRRIVLLRPNALQVGWQEARARAADQ